MGLIYQHLSFLWDIVGKAITANWWCLERLPMTSLAEIAACRTWPVVQLSQTAISDRAEVDTCTLGVIAFILGFRGLKYNKVQINKGL